jgi:hypothetical protein
MISKTQNTIEEQKRLKWFIGRLDKDKAVKQTREENEKQGNENTIEEAYDARKKHKRNLFKLPVTIDMDEEIFKMKTH